MGKPPPGRRLSTRTDGEIDRHGGTGLDADAVLLGEGD